MLPATALLQLVIFNCLPLPSNTVNISIRYQTITLEKEATVEYRNFVAANRWFSLQLPSNWMECGDEEGTYLFVDMTGWTGNLRVSPIPFQEPGAARKYLEEVYQNTLSKNSGKMKMGDHDCISFRECLEEAGFVMYYWFLEKRNFAFVFSFSTDKENDGTQRNEEELEKIRNIIMTIKTIE